MLAQMTQSRPTTVSMIWLPARCVSGADAGGPRRMTFGSIVTSSASSTEASMHTLLGSTIVTRTSCEPR